MRTTNKLCTPLITQIVITSFAGSQYSRQRAANATATFLQHTGTARPASGRA